MLVANRWTHSDVPGAFSVGLVVTGESFAGHDARVCDQVSPTEEDGPEKVQTEPPITAVPHMTYCVCVCLCGGCSHTESLEARPP